MNLRVQSLIEKRRITWWPLFFTVFIGFLFVDPFQRHAKFRVWALTFAGVAIFLALYTIALAFWYKKYISLAAIAGVALLGFLFAPFNGGAAIFIIFATAFVPYAVGGEISSSAWIIAVILTGVGLESWLLHLTWIFWAYSAGYAVVLGIGNTFAARQAFATERIAKIDERERIARDMHDVLGHTLSLITLKSELAGKLVDENPKRAKAEIGDVEKISREALVEVRHAIRGYRVESLQAELDRAKSTLETAGLMVECHASRLEIEPTHETVLGLILREAVTNVVRHARARMCRLQLQQIDGTCCLVIQDDGRGSGNPEGYGLRGMRERVEALGGTFLHDTRAGTRLSVTLPLGIRKNSQNR